MYKDEKFYKFLQLKIDFIDKTHFKRRVSKDDKEKSELEETLETEYEELANLLIGKLQMIWNTISASPEGDKKDKDIIMFCELLDEFEEDLFGNPDE